MVSKKLVPVIIGLKVFVFLIIFFCLVSPQAAISNITPDRIITIVADKPEVPEWKTLWDEARKNVQENNYPAASKLYERLSKIKPNIEAANWEYCKVLVQTEDFSFASKIIFPLLEKSPNRIDYLLAAGMISLQQKEYSLAIKQFGKVYESDPGGTQSTLALLGLIDSLKGEGRYDVAFPLREQLYVRQPDNVVLLYGLARDAEFLGNTVKAKSYYSKLLGKGTIDAIDDKIIFNAANLFDHAGSEEDAVPLWREYIRRNQNYLPFYRKLADFFLAKEDGRSALPYLLFLSEKIHPNGYLLVKIAEINLHELGRPDKALRYYEKYMENYPGDKNVEKKISAIQTILAKDFLSIVENDGALLLWQDLEKVTPNRLAIYLKIAALLEQNEKLDEQLEILFIIHDYQPLDDKIGYKIVDNYRKRKEYGLALGYLEKISTRHSSTKRHFLLKGELEELEGLEEIALASFSDGLRVDNSDLDLRKSCISKAGDLGLVAELEKLFKDNPQKNYGRENIDFILNYFDQLSYNSLFSRLEEDYRHFLTIFKNDPETLFQLQIHRAKTLRTEGKPRKAEELNRKVLNLDISDSKVLFILVINAIEDNNIEEAKAWYSAFTDKIETYPPSPEKDKLLGEKLLLDIKFMMAAGEVQEVVNSIRLVKKEPRAENKDLSFDFEVYQLEKELCWLYIEKDDYNKCGQLVKRLANKRRFDPEISVIRDILDRKSGGTTFGVPSQQDLFIGKQPVLSRLLQTVQVELEHGEYDSAEQHLGTVLKTGVDSLVGQVLLAELFFARGKIEESIESYEEIHERLPEEYSFQRKIAENEYKRGEYENGIRLLSKENKGLRQIDTAVTYNDLSSDFDEIVLFARMLWGSKQVEKSLKVYELLLNPPVIELLEKKFELEEIYYLYFTREKSFWHSLLFLLQTEPEIIAELMAPPFIIDNIGNKTGKIVVEYYELYSWQQSILNEYLARKAIVQRKYVAAERNYKRLLEEEESTEGLRDLASIYDRFGEYRKEAQVYEKIRSAGVASPELVSSMEKTSMKIRPHSGLDLGYLEKNGRNGYVNLENFRYGTSLQFTPDLEKDVKFQFFRNRYSETDSSESIAGIFLESSGIIEILSETDLLFSGSAERFDGRSGTNFHYSLGLRSQLDDYFSVYMEGYRSKVDDTMDAVIDGIYSDGFEIGLTGETPAGLTIGGDYRHQYYSDGNSQNRFHAFSSYKIYREAMHFGLQYDYQYLDNSDSNRETRAEDGSESVEKLYWKPATYSEHKLTLHFQQLIKGDYGSDDLLSYYTFDNSLGYEDPQNLLYTGQFDIFLEISPHYLLKGNFLFTNSDDYEEVSFIFSLFYRW
ncbi:MAG: hypothetical protein BA866_12855 [Desulfobulbaceae bacterium S5133MH15]|nr:MAG: hypothetical protein BA866_12855 [Desulfobulbaceae bacterium S5133MH15]